MELTRREAVGVVASGLLAGCAGAGVPSVPGMRNPLGGDGGSAPEGETPTPTATPGANAATPTTTATPVTEDPGAETGRVFDELEWFATRYEPETGQFRSLAGRTRNLADSLSRRSSVGDDAMTTLKRLAARVEETAHDRLGPHFDASLSIRSFNRERIDRVETLRAREDWDAVSTVLSEVSDRYATYESEAYVERTFPRDPVRGPLVRYAAGEGYAGEVGFVAYHVGSGEVVRARRHPADGEVLPGGPTDVDRYRTLFGPLTAEGGGEAGAYVTVTSLAGGRSVPLSIRRYRNEDAASAAVGELLDGEVTAERTARPGGREWQRVFYRSENDVMYAELTHAGRFVIAAGPARQPWEDRPAGWRLPIELTWLGGRT